MASHAAAEGSGGGRWRTPGGLVALAALATASLVAVSLSQGHFHAQTDLMGLQAAGGAYTYMLRGIGGQQGYFTGQRQQAVDFADPSQSQTQQLEGLQPVPCSQSLAGCPQSQAEEMANPAGAPTYNSGEGMTYMPSTQSGVSDQDQSPTLSKEFLDDEEKSKKHMKKLAKLLKKSAKAQDLLDVKVIAFCMDDDEMCYSLYSRA